MRKPFILTMLICTVITLSGCAHECVYSSFPNNISTKKVSSGVFSSKAKIGQLGTYQAQTGMTMAKATVTNTTNDKQMVNYKFTWFNSHGVPAGESNPMTPLALYPNQSQVITSVAPDVSANQFSLQVCR